MNNTKSIIVIVLLNSITAIGMEIVTHQAPLKKQSVNEFFDIPTMTINAAKEEEKIKKKIGMNILNGRRWWYVEQPSSPNKTATPPFFNHSIKGFSSKSNCRKNKLYADYSLWTLEQLLLKKILNTWILVEKPDKNISSYKLLLRDVAKKFKLTEKELKLIWKSLPDYIQSALWESLYRKIQQYGKITDKCIIS